MAAPILLVNPNRIRPPIAPIAIDYLAEALTQAGLPYEVLDLCFSQDPSHDLQSAVATHNPLAVALTLRNTDDCFCATQHSFIPDLQALVAAIRRMTPAPIVLGGAGYSVAPVGILRRVGADFGVCGDGEAALIQLAAALRAGRDISQVPGLVWWCGDKIRMNPPTWVLPSQQPLPRRAIDNERYFREGGQIGIETKRGCPQRCIYCADPLGKGSVIRIRPPRAVASEMLSLASRGINYFHTCDSEFNNDPQHAEAVCRELIHQDTDGALSWYAYCSPVPFSPRLAELMSRAGCVGINFGADSGHPEMLARLGRRHTPGDIIGAAKACRENGIAVMFDLLLGAPGETRESVTASIELMKTAEPDCVGVSLGVRIYAGTPLGRDLASSLAAGRQQLGFLGHLADNEELALPVFYLSPELGDDPAALLKELIADDQRFFFGWPDDAQADYNYDDNPELTEAIRNGHRGAYWDILRKLRGL